MDAESVYVDPPMEGPDEGLEHLLVYLAAECPDIPLMRLWGAVTLDPSWISPPELDQIYRALPTYREKFIEST